MLGIRVRVRDISLMVLESVEIVVKIYQFKCTIPKR